MYTIRYPYLALSGPCTSPYPVTWSPSTIHHCTTRYLPPDTQSGGLPLFSSTRTPHMFLCLPFSHSIYRYKFAVISTSKFFRIKKKFMRARISQNLPLLSVKSMSQTLAVNLIDFLVAEEELSSLFAAARFGSVRRTGHRRAPVAVSLFFYCRQC